MTSQLPDATLTRAQVTDLLQINPSTLDRLTRNGKLPCFRVGTAVRYDEADVAAYLDSIKSTPKTPPAEPEPAPAPTGRRRRTRPHPFA